MKQLQMCRHHPSINHCPLHHSNTYSYWISLEAIKLNSFEKESDAKESDRNINETICHRHFLPGSDRWERSNGRNYLH
jgi:hypothetical protein